MHARAHVDTFSCRATASSLLHVLPTAACAYTLHSRHTRKTHTLVAPFMASAMACVDLSVCNHMQCHTQSHAYIMHEECHLL